MSDNYPTDWDSRRERVYKRDNYTCQNCGAEGGNRGHTKVHAHHIVPTSRGGTHNMSNLTTICKQCHKAVHNKNINARKEESSEDSINPDNYEGMERGAVMIAMRLAEFGSISKKLLDYVVKINKNTRRIFEHVENAEETVPNKLEEYYIELRTEYSNVVVKLRSQLAHIRKVLPQFDFPEEFVCGAESNFDIYQKFVQAAVELEKAYSQIAKIETNQMTLFVANADSVEWDIGVTIAAEKLNSTAQNVSNAYSNINKSINSLSEVEIQFR